MGLEQKLVPFFVLLGFYWINQKPYAGYPEETYRSVICKILPIAALLGVVMTSPIGNCGDNKALKEARERYRYYIGIGLIFSMGGDACLVWRDSLFIPGMLSFALAQACYVKAFGTEPFGPMKPFLISYGIALGMYLWFWLTIEDATLSLLVAIYHVLILGMAWRSVVRLQISGSSRTIFACFGALSFVFSDLIIAINKWKFPVDNASAVVMTSYYAAQFGIAVSVAL